MAGAGLLLIVLITWVIIKARVSEMILLKSLGKRLFWWLPSDKAFSWLMEELLQIPCMPSAWLTVISLIQTPFFFIVRPMLRCTGIQDGGFLMSGSPIGCLLPVFTMWLFPVSYLTAFTCDSQHRKQWQMLWLAPVPQGTHIVTSSYGHHFVVPPILSSQDSNTLQAQQDWGPGAYIKHTLLEKVTDTPSKGTLPISELPFFMLHPSFSD